MIESNEGNADVLALFGAQPDKPKAALPKAESKAKPDTTDAERRRNEWLSIDNDFLFTEVYGGEWIY